MKQLIIFVLILFVIIITPVHARSSRMPVLNRLEDFFRFESVEQLTSYFGAKNVFTESAYYDDPNLGGKPFLVSQVNFGTPFSVLVVWNNEGNQLCEVQTSAYYYDEQNKKLILIQNKWKTYQGIHAGMNLSQLVVVNWFALTFRIHKDGLDNGVILHSFGWLKDESRVPFSTQKLEYTYTLDLKRIKEFFPELPAATLKSNNKLVRKWNPMLELVTIYREGLKPDK
jgi:hypothetical protein